MKKTWIPLLVFLAAASAPADVTRENGRVLATALPPVDQADEALGAEELEQLRALGYIQ